MSGQAGIWNLDGQPPDRDFLQKMSGAMARHAPEGAYSYFDDVVGMLYRPVHTTRESRLEQQPYVHSHGFVITWDGRLDNREDLIAQLRNDLVFPQTDVAIVAAAFARWKSECFRALLGDWATSIWEPTTRTLTLAEDYMGVRHLYYNLSHRRIVWCTGLAPIILLSGASFTLNDEYIAGYLAMYPPAHLTPYREVLAVPPGSFVTIERGRIASRCFWSPDHKKRIRYKADTDYEEHFRQLFRKSVRRRLRADSPILGELSGGLDSSSIICMSDDILGKGEVEPIRLDTVSFYDPKEHGGDERGYFEKVEAKRGRTGHHFNMDEYRDYFTLDYRNFIPAPGSSECQAGLRNAVYDLVQREGYRVVLSGIGGDEFLGGVPDPIPQLADSIVLLRPIQLARQLKAWSLTRKMPWIQLLVQALVRLFPAPARAMFMEQGRVPNWISPRFARRHQIARCQLGPESAASSWLPSDRDYTQSIVAMTRQLAFFPQHFLESEERRYPFLDRELIEFLSAIPANQLLRPGQRRSLMRRALVGLVPSEVLARRTKANGARGALADLHNCWLEMEALFTSPLSAQLGYVDQGRLEEHLRAAKGGDASQLFKLLKAIYLEMWLRSLADRALFQVDAQTITTKDGSFTDQGHERNTRFGATTNQTNSTGRAV
ncbi:MAG: asparagine synthase-related protein [Candidatus Acidiferrales bacterium]